ncbi:MAG: TonB-dependent receptor [Acidobacteria bacterium]|nr:TonB-dependent receptor [Acidobacteriota bacterium]
MLSAVGWQRVYVLAAAMALIVAMTAGTAEAQSGGGLISGVAKDTQGGVLPGVTVTLRNQASGVTRTTVSEGDGSYRFPALNPGRYTVTAELSGFSTVEVTNIEMTIGLGLTQDFTMQVQSLSETITVTGEAPVVDTTKSEVSGLVTQQQIETLPINSRQYLSLALLMPGTSMDSTRAFFATVNVGGSMTFNSTGNIVDGVINNFAEDGEPRQNLPEDAVEEFKVSNVQYKAEFGLATGGIVQVVTKSGTNTLRGTAFEYFRDKSLNARGIFESDKPAYRRNQFGGSIGGPIVRDKVHFFGAVERTKIDEFYTVRTAFPEFYSALEGTFARPFTRNLYFARVDGQLTNTQNFFARYAHEDEKSTCNGCGGTTASTAGFDQETPRRSLVFGHTWLRGTRQLNDFRFQYARAAYYISPAGTDIWTDIGNNSAERLNRLTRQYIFPSVTYGSSNDQIGPESRWQVKDTYALTFDAHDVKFGVDISHMPYKYESTGNPLGTFTFSRDQYFNPNDPAAIAALTGANTFSASIPPVVTSHPNSYYVAFVQDDWKLRDNLTLNLGLRWERLYGAANEDLDPSVFPVAIPYIDVGARGDRNNFGPRTGVAWDVFGTGKTVVRGGYGLYYGHVRILGNLSEFRNYQQFSVNITNPGYPDPYGGRDPRDFIVSGPANITVVANDYVQPYSNQFNVGFSHQLGGDFALHVDGVLTNTNHDRKILDINARVPGAATRPNPTFARVDENQSTGSVRYRALYTKLEKRFANRHQFMVTYTYMRARDNAPLGRYLDPFNPDLDWGPSNGERRHAVVASGSVLLPYDVTLGLVWTARTPLPWNATAGRDINADGFNTDLVPGTTRNSGSRTLDLAAVNAYRQAIGRVPIPESQIDSSRINLLDMRVSKAIRLGGDRKVDLVAQLFNALNTKNLQGQYGGGRVTNASSDAFGRIQTARPGRQAELAVRLSW